MAQVTARAGLDTVLMKMTEGPVEAGKQKIAKALQRDVEKQRCTAEELDATLGRLSCTNKIHDLAECDLVIESIVEELPEKRDYFARLDDVVKDKAHLRHQHLDAHGRRARRGDQAPDALHRPALLQSGAADEAGRDRADARAPIPR